MHRRPSAPAPRRAAWAVAPVLAVVLAVSACGDDGDETATDRPTVAPTSSSTPAEDASESPSESTPAPTATSIQVKIEGHEVTPSGDRVRVRAGEPIVFDVTADAPGSLHVHSTPESVLEYDEGSTKLELVIDQPGVVEVESHEAHAVVVQLEVR